MPPKRKRAASKKTPKRKKQVSKKTPKTKQTQIITPRPQKAVQHHFSQTHQIQKIECVKLLVENLVTKPSTKRDEPVQLRLVSFEEFGDLLSRGYEKQRAEPGLLDISKKKREEFVKIFDLVPSKKHTENFFSGSKSCTIIVCVRATVKL